MEWTHLETAGSISKKNSEQHKTTWDKLSPEMDFLLDYFIHWCKKQNFKLTEKIGIHLSIRRVSPRNQQHTPSNAGLITHVYHIEHLPIGRGSCYNGMNIRQWHGGRGGE